MRASPSVGGELHLSLDVLTHVAPALAGASLASWLLVPWTIGWAALPDGLSDHSCTTGSRQQSVRRSSCSWTRTLPVKKMQLCATAVARRLFVFMSSLVSCSFELRLQGMFLLRAQSSNCAQSDSWTGRTHTAVLPPALFARVTKPARSQGEMLLEHQVGEVTKGTDPGDAICLSQPLLPSGPALVARKRLLTSNLLATLRCSYCKETKGPHFMSGSAARAALSLQSVSYTAFSVNWPHDSKAPPHPPPSTFWHASTLHSWRQLRCTAGRAASAPC